MIPQLPNLHGVVVVTDGETKLEHYGSGEDYSWGRPLGHVDFGPRTLHDLRSVTKSIVGLVYGIAMKQGLVPDPQAPLLDAFPEYPHLAEEPARRRLTVRHALTMTLGMEWDESLPYTDPRNSEIAMEMAQDRYRFILERPIVEEPGRRWTYSGGATALVGKLIVKGTGVSLHDYARRVLLDPVGIESSEWMGGRDGEVSAASGLRLTPRDLARIGCLVLEGGDGIVPREWLDASLTPKVRVNEEREYGYHWYLLAGGIIAAMGNGGQRLWIVPDRRLVVAATFGNYDRPEGATAPPRLLDAILRVHGG